MNGPFSQKILLFKGQFRLKPLQAERGLYCPFQIRKQKQISLAEKMDEVKVKKSMSCRKCNLFTLPDMKYNQQKRRTHE